MIVVGLLLILFVGEWVWGVSLMLIGILLHLLEVGFKV